MWSWHHRHQRPTDGKTSHDARRPRQRPAAPRSAGGDRGLRLGCVDDPATAAQYTLSSLTRNRDGQHDLGVPGPLAPMSRADREECRGLRGSTSPAPASSTVRREAGKQLLVVGEGRGASRGLRNSGGDSAKLFKSVRQFIV